MIIGTVVLILLGSGCTVTETVPATTVEQLPSLFDDPFAYCQAVGTIDAPDEHYIGAEMPDSIIQGLLDQGIVSADAPAEIQGNAVWRCMNNKVWVCHFGANLPCQEKADKSTEPSAAMEEYCQQNPDTDIIPAATTGRATVYSWSCSGGKPVAGEQILTSDLQGFLAEFWYELD